jgi:hypothetical protein
MTKFRRVYEAAILKTLGANSRLIASMLLLEYGVLGAIAGTVGSLGAIALSWAVARYALELDWEATPLITLGGIVATSIFVAAIGVLASVDVLRHKPLATLRAPAASETATDAAFTCLGGVALDVLWMLGVDAGRLVAGAEADIAVIDPDRPWIVNSDKMAASAGNTPFDRQGVQGRVIALFKGGTQVA